MADPATHPAFLAADLAAAFASTTTGHAFSSGVLEVLVHDDPDPFQDFSEGILFYNG
jgi:hypothetical protein